MNHPAEVLFASLHGSLLSCSRSLASRLRALVGPEKLSVQQHKDLETIIQSELEPFVWDFLGRFDNVGCTLPPGILGYNIIANLSAERERLPPIRLQAVDIREGEQDYSDMWYEYLALKTASGRGKPTPDDCK
jgi:hypothetical protein